MIGTKILLQRHVNKLPKSKRKQMHHGIDMAGTWQEEVRAPADGYVSFSGRNGSFGKTIKIVHNRLFCFLAEGPEFHPASLLLTQQ